MSKTKWWVILIIVVVALGVLIGGIVYFQSLPITTVIGYLVALAGGLVGGWSLRGLYNKYVKK